MEEDCRRGHSKQLKKHDVKASSDFNTQALIKSLIKLKLRNTLRVCMLRNEQFTLLRAELWYLKREFAYEKIDV